MAKIHSENTLPERLAAKILSSAGHRYRLNVKSLPGKPDFVLKKYKTVIFIHGCFWHSHNKCPDGHLPKTRISYWKKKLSGNKNRYARHIKALKGNGWKVLRFWACEVENKPEAVSRKIRKSFEKAV